MDFVLLMTVRVSCLEVQKLRDIVSNSQRLLDAVFYSSQKDQSQLFARFDGEFRMDEVVLVGWHWRDEDTNSSIWEVIPGQNMLSLANLLVFSIPWCDWWGFWRGSARNDGGMRMLWVVHLEPESYDLATHLVSVGPKVALFRLYGVHL